MRTNLPVTQREYEMPADATLMSTTDTSSRITTRNAAFVAASNFDAECARSTHNIIRHPDMPPEAFADMGNPEGRRRWTALVKNRRKNGDHYWVRANATAVRTNGRRRWLHVGAHQAHTRRSPRPKKPATGLRHGKTNRVAFYKGLVVRQTSGAGVRRCKCCRFAGACERLAGRCRDHRPAWPPPAGVAYRPTAGGGRGRAEPAPWSTGCGWRRRSPGPRPGLGRPVRQAPPPKRRN